MLDMFRSTFGHHQGNQQSFPTLYMNDIPDEGRM